ncbi:hypothetical protein JKP88DRAFT_349849 [Tribonema minus]|uniref:Uncharacterized protein n=1 Tax=Tribonema minus TaxID=303371 RepID=A0A836CBI9_9STRA|nr:hypothetical protein JKP88DRAFT_349849 [Tribonema minus]
MSFLDLHSDSAEARQRAYRAATEEYGEALARALHASFSALPDDNSHHWYEWGIALLEAKEEMTAKTADRHIAQKGMVVAAGVSGALLLRGTGPRSLLWSLLSLAFTAEAAATIAARRRLLERARADVKQLVAALERLAGDIESLLAAVAAAARMMKCAQAAAMGLRLALPMPPVARMEAAARNRRAALQLPSLRACAAEALQLLRAHVARCTSDVIAATTSAARAGPAPAPAAAAALPPQQSPGGVLLLAEIADAEAALTEELHQFVLAVARALAASETNVSSLRAAVASVGGCLRSAAERLHAALGGGAAGAAPPPPQELAAAIASLRLSCEAAVVALYRAQVQLASPPAAAHGHGDAGAAATAAAAAAQLAGVAQLLTAAAHAWTEQQASDLVAALEQARELSAAAAAAPGAAAIPSDAASVGSGDGGGGSGVPSISSAGAHSPPFSLGDSWIPVAQPSSPAAALYSLYESLDEAGMAEPQRSAAAGHAAAAAAAAERESFTDVLVATGGPDASPGREGRRRARSSSSEQRGAASASPQRQRQQQQQRAAARSRDELLGELSFALSSRAHALPPPRVKGLQGAPPGSPLNAAHQRSAGVAEGVSGPRLGPEEVAAAAAAAAAADAPHGGSAQGLMSELRGRLGGEEQGDELVILCGGETDEVGSGSSDGVLVDPRT